MSLVLLFSVLAAISAPQPSVPDSSLVLFWNVENFFDYIDGGNGESDKEFSWSGTRRWTKKRFYTKCNAISKSLYWVADYFGRIPDFVGFAEVENAFVLRRLLQATALRKAPYSIVHFDSPDRRGIDVALIYNKNNFDLIDAKPCRVEGPPGDSNFATRDILLARFCQKGPERKEIVLAVNHHPSKYGGKQSSGGRIAAMKRLRQLADSVRTASPGVPFVAMGDFNDTPDGEAFDILTKAIETLPLPLENQFKEAFEQHQGTIRYNGLWELIDLFFVSPEARGRAEILQIPFLMEWDNTHAGYKPKRTYVGPRWVGGVSDHCPISLYFPL